MDKLRYYAIYLIILILIIWSINQLYLGWKRRNEYKDWQNAIGKYLKKHAKKYAKRRNVKKVDVPDDAIITLEEYCKKLNKKEINGKHYTLAFCASRGLDPDSLNADAGLDHEWPIIASPLWAAKLVFEKQNPEVPDAFEMTLGHELSHKEDVDHNICGFWGRRFIRTLNEVRADIGAADKMRNGNRYVLEQACLYKKSHKKWDLWIGHHPSWKKRAEYAANYNFDAQLIRKIADDMPLNFLVHYFKLVDKAIVVYADRFIYLKPEIEINNIKQQDKKT